ncbi:MAG: rRNA synthase [Frankiales bacterium]|jgi:23S rRNA pseudouridine2605 synthase|nr:rRNA synthase [Frankiales bacterium]
MTEGIRLQKVLATAGVGSRRACEELISAGRVSVDGHVVDVLGARVNPGQAIHVDGLRIITDPERVYLALNKPRGMLTTLSDPQGRSCVGDIVRGRDERLFHVGRLDADSEGLLLLTNDGDLAHRLMHPSHGVPKTYLAEVAGPLPRGVGRTLREGVDLEDGRAAVTEFRVLDRVGKRLLVEVEVTEGRNRLVRRLLAAVGLPVDRLVRTRMGPVVLGELRPGRSRVLTADEVGALHKAAGL